MNSDLKLIFDLSENPAGKYSKRVTVINMMKTDKYAKSHKIYIQIEMITEELPTDRDLSLCMDLTCIAIFQTR